VINTLLIDIEGTLVERGGAVPGAPLALAELSRRGLNIRLLTNISSRPAEILAGELVMLGFDGIKPAHIHTSASAARRLLVKERASFSDLLLPDGVAHLFSGLPLDRTAPDYVVVGDVAERFSYENLSAAFRLLHSGSRLMALQRNLYWEAAGGAMLDAGAFVAALEAASGRAATLSGKPSAAFFRGALEDASGEVPATLVVGDDQTTDIAGAHALGARAVMVGTGKGTRIDPDLAGPDYRLASVADLPELVDRLRSGD
jgi:inorganic pyrophosphatase